MVRIPISSESAFPSFLSATARVASSSRSTIVLLRNLESDLGILPFMSLLIDLKASAVFLNFWKSSRVILHQNNWYSFRTAASSLKYLRMLSTFESFFSSSQRNSAYPAGVSNRINIALIIFVDAHMGKQH